MTPRDEAKSLVYGGHCEHTCGCDCQEDAIESALQAAEQRGYDRARAEAEESYVTNRTDLKTGQTQ